MGGTQNQSVVHSPPIPGSLKLIPTRNMADKDQIPTSSQVGGGQSLYIVHPLPTQALYSKTSADFMILTFAFMILTQVIAGFYCVNKTTFYAFDRNANGFYSDFITDIDVQTHYFVRGKFLTQCFNIAYFRSGEFFLNRAREMINERRKERATEKTRLLTARKDGVWSNRKDGLKMEEIKKRMNLRIAGLTKKPAKDCEFMGRWLGYSKQDCFVDSGFFKLDDVMFPSEMIG